MSHRLYRVIGFEIVGEYSIWMKFDDGFDRVIDFEPILYGEVFGPLRDPEIFDQVTLDPEARTLVWPTGGDFDPETLRNWDDESMAKLGQTWAVVAESSA